MITIQRYTSDQCAQWNAFIDASINGTFILRRSYMDYHQEIFEDFSFFVFYKNQPLALFVAGHPKGKPYDTLMAHPGLTYGGLVTTAILKYHQTEEVFAVLLDEIRALGFKNMVVKLVARSFCQIYSETAKFFLIKKGFKLVRQELNSVLLLHEPFLIGSRRVNNQKKFAKAGGLVCYSDRVEEYWDLLAETLQTRHQTAPAHKVTEMRYLKDANSSNIRFLGAEINSKLVAGVVVFVDLPKGFAHTQYIASSEEGKSIGAIDAIMLALIKEFQPLSIRLSFGISTVQGDVNPGLLLQKEEYGSVGDIFEVYQGDVFSE